MKIRAKGGRGTGEFDFVIARVGKEWVQCTGFRPRSNQFWFNFRIPVMGLHEFMVQSGSYPEEVRGALATLAKWFALESLEKKEME